MKEYFLALIAVREHLLRAYLALVVLALFASGLVQFYVPQLLASPGTWALAPGWEREIAFWNFAIGIMIVRLLRGRNTHTLLTVVFGMVVLTGLLGANHLKSVLWETVPFWHAALAALNILGAIGGVLVLHLYNQPESRIAKVI